MPCIIYTCPTGSVTVNWGKLEPLFCIIYMPIIIQLDRENPDSPSSNFCMAVVSDEMLHIFNVNDSVNLDMARMTIYS